MRLVLEKKEGVFSEQYEELMGMLGDGKYLVTIRSLNENKTEREFRNEYFALLDIISAHNGDHKYAIHLMFKKHRNIETTTNFSLQDWVNFIDSLKWWAFDNLDLVL